ncbi:Uncharacterized WD repeat-containing protein C17D11.16 [Triticum urartu]|uniref:Uncharacterized WD repeat-containing protein C17D11.16 n=2 Tax=Triticum TaxID=4564 RepID=M8AC98_TRIUA|nr:Uncharacterized WD repeat-containing protein C17D11.16 [Triticum urartu]
MTVHSAHRDDGSDAEADADDGEMEVDGADEEENEDVAQAKVAAEALGKTGSGGAVGGVSHGLEELHMEDYDDEDDEPELLSAGGRGDLYYENNEEDPHLIRNSDVSIVEELEDGDLNMYVHHEVPLSDFPLCTAWMDFNFKDAKKEGNFIAVGTMDPAIEIWNLDIVMFSETYDTITSYDHELFFFKEIYVLLLGFDVITQVDEVKPHIVLGGLSKNREKVKGEKGKIYKEGSHKSSVLGLAWNAVVQSVAWRSPEVLLSGSFDRSVAMTDMRGDGRSCHKWSVEADVESLACDPHNEHTFVVSLENGTVQAFDTRTASSHSNCGQPMFTLHAHDKAVSSISFTPSTPNLLATGSTDNTGAIFSVSFSNDSPFLLACGGSKGKLKVWNTLLEPAVANRFGK